jgi:DNA invertase Pin-like site-specific DNA recombinase
MLENRVMTRRRVGYGRVSRTDSDPRAQRTELETAGVDEVFIDDYRATVSTRPEFLKAVERLQPGDSLVVTSLDRLARSARDLAVTVQGLEDGGVELEIIRDQLTTRSSEGRLLFKMASMFAEFEHAVMISRNRDGLATARARDLPDPRRRLTDGDKQEIRRLYGERSLSARELAVRFRVSRPTIYRALDLSRDAEHPSDGLPI